MKYFANKGVRRTVIVGVAGLLFLVACCVNSATSYAWGSESEAHAYLRHVPYGWSSLRWNSENETLQVTISLIGMAPNSVHPAHIHLGYCYQNGAILYPLNDVVADATGAATVTTTISGVEHGIPATGWYINVHNGPGLGTPLQFLPISCSNIRNPSHSNYVKLSMNTAPFPNEDAYGSARLKLVDEKLTVFIWVAGLGPYSEHAAHIHAGNCRATGGIVFDLSPLVANANGVATKTIVFNEVQLSSIPQGAWDINVHLTTDLSTQTGYDPITCGNVEDE
jgi:hypothetical protein